MAEQREQVAHHFVDAGQQHEAASLGMWVFLATEIMLFGGLFLGYTVYRMAYPEMFHEMSQHLNFILGTANTFILITSSLTMAMAVHSVREDHKKKLIIFLLLTIFLGTTFLGIKAVEYYEEYKHNLIPLPGWEFKEAPGLPGSGRLFMALYFTMTALHAFHLLIGIGLMLVMTGLSLRGNVSVRRPLPIEISGMYWHLVDVIWVFLYPLLYLVGR